MSLFLKDMKAENEIHRAALKFLKTAVAFISMDLLKSERGLDLIDSILNQGIFSLPTAKRNKHGALIKKLVGKLIKKVGSQQIRKAVPSKHHALLDYIERARRKRMNKAKRSKLMALLGRSEEEVKEAIKEESDSESEEEEEMGAGEDAEMEEHFESDSDEGLPSSDEEEEEEAKRGADLLATGGIDIPRVDNIPVVSKLAKERKQELERSKLAQL